MNTYVYELRPGMVFVNFISSCSWFVISVTPSTQDRCFVNQLYVNRFGPPLFITADLSVNDVYFTEVVSRTAVLYPRLSFSDE